LIIKTFETRLYLIRANRAISHIGIDVRYMYVNVRLQINQKRDSEAKNEIVREPRCFTDAVPHVVLLIGLDCSGLLNVTVEFC